MRKLLTFGAYREVNQELLAQLFNQLDTAAQASKKNAEKAISADASITSERKGFAYLNDLFVKRHRRILWSATKKITFVCAFLVAGAALLLYMFPEGKADVNELVETCLPYFVFIMYAALLFLYYFNDVSGTILTVLSFFFVTFGGSVISMRLPEIWQGMGLVAGALAGWTVAYMRLRWVEKNLDVHIFCRGAIIKQESGQMPSSLVYRKADENEEKENR